ncbi:hypothetical protein N7520_007600, partial [Penicillium odoratum]|uniref:uncharacterized protein n=1 Tax=Penicillium odoratum TaxID=1167516 RepID=UPI002547ECF6
MASVENQFFMDASTQEWVDFDQFLDLSPSYSDDYSANSISPEMSLPYDADLFTNDLPDLTQPGFSDMTNYDLSHEVSFVDQSPNVGLVPDFVPPLDNAMFHGYQSYDTTFDFRQMVEAQAALDPRVASLKEKRREAAIALHLQRLCDATALDLEMSSDSNTSFSSPCWSDYMRESISPRPNSASPEETPAPSRSGNGGMEMVLDLNMNATANLPKKQKPRSQAQKENYIKARKYGACEKHKKQHKRCNCLEKAAARAGVSEVPMDVAVKRPRQQFSTASTLQPSYSSRVSDHAVPRVIETVRPPVDAPKRVIVKSPMTNSSVSSSGVQPFTRTTASFTRNNSGHAPEYSTSFVLSPVPDTSQRAQSSNRSLGQAAVPQSSAMQYSSVGRSPQPNRKSVGLPTSRGVAMGSSSSNSPTAAQCNVSTAKSVPTTGHPERGIAHILAREAQRPKFSLVKRVASGNRNATKAIDQPQVGDTRNRDLCVIHTRTSLLQSLIKNSLSSLPDGGSTERIRSSLPARNSGCAEVSTLATRSSSLTANSGKVGRGLIVQSKIQSTVAQLGVFSRALQSVFGDW